MTFFLHGKGPSSFVLFFIFGLVFAWNKELDLKSQQVESLEIMHLLFALKH